MNSELFIRLKHNPFVSIGNVAYIICEIFDWKGEGFTKCKLKQISNIERLFKKSTIKTKLEININPNPINPIPPIEPEEPIEPSLPEVAENEDILAIENVDTVEGTVLMRNPNNISIQYSTNGSEFNEYTAESEISIKPAEKVYFKWSDVIGNESNSTALVNTSVKYKAYGEFKKGNERASYIGFFHNTKIVDASELQLTATELGFWSYYHLFSQCTLLTSAPEIPNVKLTSSSALGFLFYGCSKLNYVKHNITEWDTNATTNWLSNVASSGTIECPANSTIPSNNTSGIPSGWIKKTF